MSFLASRMRLASSGLNRDPFYASVDVLLPFTSDANDYGPSSRTITVNGTPTYGASGATLNGSTDYFNYQGTAIGTNDFIIEGLFNTDALGADDFIFDYRPNATNGAYPALYITAGGVLSYLVTSNVRIASSALSAGVEYYFAVFRTSGTTRLQVDDQIVGSWTDSTNYLAPTSRPFIGLDSFSSSLYWDGKLREFRVTIGTDRDRAASISGSTADVPSTPFPTN